MRIVGYIDHAKYKITIMHMNHRFALKFEDGSIEQTYKIRVSDHISSADDVKTVVTPEILASVSEHFKAMEATRLAMLFSDEGDKDEEFEEIV